MYVTGDYQLKASLQVRFSSNYGKWITIDDKA